MKSFTPQERFLSNAYLPPAQFAEFVVDKDKCAACKRCVQTCPGNILEMRGDFPVDKYLDDPLMGCIGCSNCVSVCQENAIEIRGQYRVAEGYFKTLYGTCSPPNPFRETVPPDFKAIEGDLTEVERVIYRRRSSRLFLKNKKVPDELLHRVLEVARFAPSSGNSQPWAFSVITDRAVLDKIDKACRKRLGYLPKFYKPDTAAGNLAPQNLLRKSAINLLARVAPNYFDQRMIGGAEAVATGEKRDVFLHAPAVIVVLADKRGIGDPHLDCGLAAHSLVLAAHSLGLSTCYVSFIKILANDPEFRKLVGIQWPYELVTSIALGYNKVDSNQPVAREIPPVRWVRPSNGTR